MCGIAGFFNNSQSLAPELDLSAAVDSLAHRGPDARGIWAKANIAGLGHRRLSILDLSAQGNQPMHSPDGRFALVFNGEIYNFSEIRSRLLKEGVEFSSNSDSEVILYAFIKWGKDCVTNFIGMFAFAIFDKLENKLYLCRDRLGVKPLYYMWLNGCLCFASELKAIRQFKHWQPQIDGKALGEYFQYGYISEPRTIYQHVHKLPPGNWLEIGQSFTAPNLTCYWNLNSVLLQPERQFSEPELTETLEKLLTESFSYRMVSDVKVGVFLSGGIDSSLVTALLQKNAGHQVNTYTLAFNEKQFDESPWATKIAAHLGTNHTNFVFSAKEAENVALELPLVFDEPFGDNSAISTMMLAKLVSKEVKVVLSADGGDELFGGYDYYRSIPRDFACLSKVPAILRKTVGRLLSFSHSEQFQALTNKLKNPFFKKLARNINQINGINTDLNQTNFYRYMRACWQPERIKQLLGDYHEQRDGLDTFPDSLNFAEKMMAMDLKYYIPDNILTKVDRATMAFGLEGRDPFLDHRLVELALRIPAKYKLQESVSKAILRKILYKHIPSELIERPKQGFAIPLAQWRTESIGKKIGQEIEEFVNSNESCLNKKLVKQELDFYRKSTGNEFQIWLLYVFACWHKRWI